MKVLFSFNVFFVRFILNRNQDTNGHKKSDSATVLVNAIHSICVVFTISNMSLLWYATFCFVVAVIDAICLLYFLLLYMLFSFTTNEEKNWFLFLLCMRAQLNVTTYHLLIYRIQQLQLHTCNYF